MNVSHLDYLLRPTPIYGWVRPFLERKALADWRRNHLPPAPHAIKRDVILEHARRAGLEVFIETGTFFGDTLAAVQHQFRELHSIELSAKLHRKARQRFADQPRVHLVLGDSGEQLPRLLERLAEPALFWLDGHFSGGVTARGSSDTPISRELSAVLAHPVREHVVLIDDARLFGTARDYPSVAQIREAVARDRPDWALRIESDIIRAGHVDRLSPGA